MSLALEKLGNHTQALSSAEAVLVIYEQTANPKVDEVRIQVARWREKK